MTSHLNPYLSFGDDAREAMEFYRDVFGGELIVNTFGDLNVPDVPPELVMHAQLTTASGFRLMAADTPAGHPRNVGDNIAISVFGDDADDLRGWFEKLSAGGQVTMPLQKQMWGDEFGMCTDRFGIHWMVDIDRGAGG